MKYDRPVWQIMHECADAMPDVFRYDEVRGWFAAHYPDVNEATIRAHLIGLTEGGRAKHVQFAPRSPIFRRVARGEYSPIPKAERGEDPDAQPSTSRLKMSGNGHHPIADDVVVPVATDEPVVPDLPDLPEVAPPVLDDGTAAADTYAREVAGPAGSTFDDELPPPDVILLGSVGDRVNVPAPAKEVYREVAFQLSRLDAELSGSEWFVLSAEHGLMAPNEWMSPDSRTLADMEPGHRAVWASWVVSRLGSMVGSLEGLIVRVDAPNAFVGPLFADLQDAGAAVVSGSIANDPDADAVDSEPQAPQPEQSRADLEQLVADAAARLAIHEAIQVEEPEHDEAELATVLDIGARASIARHLKDPRQAVSTDKVDTLPLSAGLYGWLVDPIGARILNRCLRLPVRPGLIFVGEVGGSSWHSLVDPVLNLRDHLDRVQLNGRTRASTFRMTLATVLGEFLGMTTLDDPRLTDWMHEHLSITTFAVDDGDDLGDVVRSVVDELDPPLNVEHLGATEYRARLQQMRGRLA